MRIKICADSTCDLSPELVARYDVNILPLYISIGDNSLRDGIEVTPADIYRHVDGGGKLPATAAITPADYAAEFEAFSAQYDAVLHITIGAGFSSCYQNACIAAEPYANVYPVDSQNLSTGQGLVVVEAAKRAAQGMDVQQLLAELQSLIPRVEASFLLDRLDYMRKGGRCSMVAVLGANLLKLKPCIEVIDGQMKVVKKYRGAYDKCIADYIRERLENRMDQLESDEAFITHAVATDPIREVAWKTVREYGSFSEVFETVAGCTVCSHCGPNTLGVLFIRRESLKSET